MFKNPGKYKAVDATRNSNEHPVQVSQHCIGVHSLADVPVCSLAELTHGYYPRETIPLRLCCACTSDCGEFQTFALILAEVRAAVEFFCQAGFSKLCSSEPAKT